MTVKVFNKRSLERNNFSLNIWPYLTRVFNKYLYTWILWTVTNIEILKSQERINKISVHNALEQQNISTFLLKQIYFEILTIFGGWFFLPAHKP